MSTSLTLTTIYFTGLVMFGAAIGSYHGIAEYTFMIIGGGAMLYSALLS
jgi:hypothetical protein